MHTVHLTLSFKSNLMLRRFPWPHEGKATVATRLILNADEVQIELSDEEYGRRSLGEMIKAKRKDIGYSQARLGRLAGVDSSTICDIERGNQQAKPETIIALLGVLEAGGEKKGEAEAGTA